MTPLSLLFHLPVYAYIASTVFHYYIVIFVTYIDNPIRTFLKVVTEISFCHSRYFIYGIVSIQKGGCRPLSVKSSYGLFSLPWSIIFCCLEIIDRLHDIYDIDSFMDHTHDIL